MNITFVAKKLDMDGGGSNFSLELMGRMLSKQGHNVDVITLDPKQNNYPDDLSFDIINSQSRFGSRMGGLEHTYRAMSEHATNTDIFHIFTPMLLPAAGYFRKNNDSTPVVSSLNTYTMFCVNMDRMNGDCHRNCTVRAKFSHQDASIRKRIAKIPLYASRTFIEPKLSKNLDAYFAISPAVKRIYSDVGLPQDRISVVPEFYDPSFGPDQVPVNGVDFDEPFQLLYVGRIEPIKGLDYLINALTQISEVELTILGTGSALSELRTLVNSMDIEDRISFEGWVSHDELPPYYRAADLFVHPTRLPEPFGRTLLESMQMGTPPLVSNIGGPPWVVGDAGLTFPQGDIERLSEILAEIRYDSDRLARLREACTDQLERFEPHKVISSIENEYSRITAR